MPDAALLAAALIALAAGFAAGSFWSRRRQRHELARLREELRKAVDEARMDPLTGIGNRKAFDERLQFLAALHQRYGAPFSVVLLDVDDLKGVNDRGGHAAGDALLCRLAAALRASIRESDLAARIGGDEFALLLPQTPLEGAQTVLARITERQEAASPIAMSAGIASILRDETPDTLLRRADEALYAEKSRSRP